MRICYVKSSKCGGEERNDLLKSVQFNMLINKAVFLGGARLAGGSAVSPTSLLASRKTQERDLVQMENGEKNPFTGRTDINEENRDAGAANKHRYAKDDL